MTADQGSPTPHKCPDCNRPAFINAIHVYCINFTCRHFDLKTLDSYCNMPDAWENEDTEPQHFVNKKKVTSDL